MNNLISIAVYSYRGPQRLECLLHSARCFGGMDCDIVVCEDYDAKGDCHAEYVRVCGEYGARLVTRTEHGHMNGANMVAVQATTSPWVLVCSDDVMVPRGLLAMLQQFLASNRMRERVWMNGVLCDPFVHQIAGIYLHHWDRSDVMFMVASGALPEVGELDERSWWSNRGEWFWRHLDGRLPDGPWTEPTPSDRVGIVSNVHGSAFVCSHQWWDAVGGCGGINCWQNDSVFSFRVGFWSAGAFFIRLPGLPSIPHYGGASFPLPPDPDGRWTQTIRALVEEHGGGYDATIRATLGTDTPQSALIEFERALKIRAMSLQKKYEREIEALDISYLELCQQ